MQTLGSPPANVCRGPKDLTIWQWINFRVRRHPSAIGDKRQKSFRFSTREF